jgi:hypothetical protein
MAEYKKGDKEKTTVVDTLNLPTGPEKVSETYTPEGFANVESYLEDMRETYELDVQADEHNRVEALDDKSFAAGNQWDPVVLEQRKGLPCLTIDTISSFTSQVTGDWRSNRNSVKVLPAEDGDVDVASVRGDLVRAIETKSRASRVYDSAFESAVQCGDGAFRVAVEYARDDVFDQEIYLRPIEDALSVVWDRMSVDPTGRDATHCFVDDSLPKKEFERRWPDTDPSEMSERQQKSLRINGWYDSDVVRVTEHWRMVERPRLLGLFEDGSVRVIEGDKLDEYYERHGQIVKTRMSPCLYAQMHLVTGFKILAGPFEYKLNRLPIVRMVGQIVNEGGKRTRTGLVRKMKDPIRLKNFWRSIAAEQLGYAPKAQWIAPESAVEGREDTFRKAHISRDPLLVYNDGAESPPERVSPPQIEAALLNESAQNAQDMKDVTGIHDASLGVRSNETSGRAIHARQREGDIANMVYHDNGNAAILEAGDVINQLIPQIYDGTRIVRLIGEDQEPTFKKINDPYDPKSINIASGNYDVQLSTGTSYMTRRVEAANAMMEAVQVYPEMMQIAGDLVAKAQDWPGAQELSERLKKVVPPHLLEDEEGGEQAQIQALQQQHEAEKQAIMQQVQEGAKQLEEEIQRLKLDSDNKAAEIDLKAQELEIKRFEAETKRLDVIAKAKIDMEGLEQQAIANAKKDKDISDGDSSTTE